MPHQLFVHKSSMTLESGITLPEYHLAYTTHGKLNETKDNVVWIFHALTANSDPAEWWPGMVGEGKLFDPAIYYIVCVNMPGSCYGSVGPLYDDPLRRGPYYHRFPFFTPRDMIRAYQPLRRFLGIEKIHIGIGGSMGGQQLLEWSIEEPGLFEFIFPLATNARHSSWGVAFNTAQRMAIEADETWREQSPNAGMEGMKAARAIALLSYRNYDTYRHKQPLSNSSPAGEGPSGAASYQRYQGEKLARRFNAYSYYALSLAMDSHDVGRERGSAEMALQLIRAKALVIGIVTDILFPVEEQEYIAKHIPHGVFKAIYSAYGHDGFLLEYEQIGMMVREFIKTGKRTPFKFAATT